MQSVFTRVAYPCFGLERDFSTQWYNPAARAQLPLFCGEGAIARLVQADPVAMNQLSAGAPAEISLVKGVLCDIRLNLVPAEGGYLAFARESTGLAEDAGSIFSEEMHESLTDIFSILPLMAKRLSSEPDGTVYADHINRSCYKLLRATANVSAISRRGSYLPALQGVDLCAMVASVCSGAQSLCRGLDIPLEYQLPEEPVIIQADAGSLTTALCNLLLNSYKYTREGNRIMVSLCRSGQSALLTVADAGMGMKPEVAAHAREPYFSCEPYNDGSPRPGLGLGLAVAQSAVQRLGGSMAIHSTFGEGTTVALTLPLFSGGGSDILRSSMEDYLLNRFSTLYVQLCEVCRLQSVY